MREKKKFTPAPNLPTIYSYGDKYLLVLFGGKKQK
jgi:hypothetical protein